MKSAFCVHGHFYQPPREDAWLGDIPAEGSAAPYRDWNERIAAESYGPLAWARRKDGGGRITRILNCYEFISFNVGPTLLRWLDRHAPETLARMVEGDRAAAARLGHGPAMAQVYHHVIMPLASDLDKRLQVRWSLADFEARFGRRPEGMWLAEAAVDMGALEILAEEGVAFTILAPRQIEAVRLQGESGYRPVGEHEVDVRQPYRVELPSGRAIAVFIYDGAISQAVAFQGLLKNGEAFLNHLRSAAAPGGLTSVATDGETYGHHFTFGEMALAYVLEQLEADPDAELTNYAAYLAAHPPVHCARVRDMSSWSCVHGVERWRSGCSCGSAPGWSTDWRGPLREALAWLKARIDAHYFARGEQFFTDAKEALLDYGRLLAGGVERKEFLARWLKPGLSAGQSDDACRLLSMQEWALSSFASCAWFFEDLARLETLNGLSFALKAMDLARETGMADPEPGFLDILGRASSNDPAKGGGLDLWREDVTPRREHPASLCLQGVLRALAEGRPPRPGAPQRVEWPSLAVELVMDDGVSGHVTLDRGVEGVDPPRPFRVEPDIGAAVAPGALTVGVASGAATATARLADLAQGKRQAVAAAWAEEALRRASATAPADGAALLDLFQPYVEGQTTQTADHAWVWLVPHMALAWTRAGDAARIPPDCFAFLRSALETPALMAAARRLAEADLIELARSANPPDVRALAARVARARELGVHPDLWRVQNVVWASPAKPSDPDAMETLGFLPG